MLDCVEAVDAVKPYSSDVSGDLWKIAEELGGGFDEPVGVLVDDWNIIGWCGLVESSSQPSVVARVSPYASSASGSKSHLRLAASPPSDVKFFHGK